MLETITKQRPVDQTGQKLDHNEFKGIRYGLEGALVGVALVGIFGWLYGTRIDNIHHDFIGALIGFVFVIVGRFFFLKRK